MNDIETRAAVECRSTTDHPVLNGDYIEGYACVWGEMTQGKVWTKKEGKPVYCHEVIEKDAFNDSLKDNVRFILEHEEDREYGDTESRTLELIPDEHGIKYRAAIPAYAKRFKEDLTNKVFEGTSFGFKAEDVEFKDGVRHVKKARLLHVSPTWSPAYKNTKFEVKSREKDMSDYHQKLKERLGK